jgi:hypothetical protein
LYKEADGLRIWTMRFPTLSALAILISWSAAPAKEPTFEWVATGGGAGNGKTRAINVDREGNVFLAGEVSGDGKFGDVAMKTSGAMDAFVAKVDPKGHFLWFQTLGGKMIDRCYGVACDKEGNVYVTGHNQKTEAPMPGKGPTTGGDYDIFVAKYDPNGKQLWMRTGGGKGYDYGHGLVVDHKGDVVITGGVVGESHFGDLAVPNDPGSHVFCAKYNAEGKLLWVKTSTGKNSSNEGEALSVDGQDNIYIGGGCSGPGTFGTKEIKAVGKGRNAFVLKLNAEGEAQWATVHSGDPSCITSNITADTQGRVWTSGIFVGKATFGGETFATTTDPKDKDGFVAHYDTNGNLLWAHAIQGPQIDYGLGIATDGKGQSFLVGEFMDTTKLAGGTLQSRGSQDIYVAGFDEKGTLEWLVQAGGEKGDNCYTAACDGMGALVVGGACVGPATFGDQKVEATKSAHLYGAKLRVK